MSDIAKTEQSLTERLTSTLATKSLRQLVEVRQVDNAVLLLDVSSSMNEMCEGNQRKIDALRDVTAAIHRQIKVKMVAFGGYTSYGATMSGSRVAQEVTTIPEPAGGTPMAEGIDYCRAMPGINHMIVVSDGMPNNANAALDSARKFGGKIDVFYVGPPNDAGADFMRRLAAVGKGSVNVTDWRGAAKALMSTQVVKMLTDGKAPTSRTIQL